MSVKPKKPKSLPDSGKVTTKIIPPLPTTFELTQIAALLSSKPVPEADPKLAEKAFQLWETCAQELIERRIFREIKDGSFEVYSMGLLGVTGEAPKSWPCSFDDALRLVMPEKRTKADRYQLFRLFLRDLILHQHAFHQSEVKNSKTSSAPSEEKMLDETGANFKTLKQIGFKDASEYGDWMRTFSIWLRDHETQKKSAQRSLAAKARWAKKHGNGSEGKTT